MCGAVQTRRSEGIRIAHPEFAMIDHGSSPEPTLRERRVDQSKLLRDTLNRLRLELTGTQARGTRLGHAALHDGLTNLPNRLHFRKRLHQVMELPRQGNRALGLICMNLDGFRHVTETYGAEVGDELLRIVAARLRHTVRAQDLVGRIGGDEFGCLVADVPDRTQVGQIARKMLAALAAPLKIGQALLAISASCGIAVFPGDGATADDLLRNADAAMHRAKKQHSGVAFFGLPRIC
jgi:diguanylate cyclase (GGDEF)-like protein